METCSILSSQIDFPAVHKALSELGRSSLELKGVAESWEQIMLTRKKWLGKAVVLVKSNVDQDQLEGFRQNMQFVFSSVPTTHTAIRRAILERIDQVQFEVKISSHRLVGMEDIVFAVAKALNGVILWDKKQILDGKGILIFDTEGNCRLPEFDGAKADETDTQAPLSDEDTQRKARSETILKARKIPGNPSLLPPFSSSNHKLRPANVLAKRCMALIVTALRGEGLDKEVVDQIVLDYGLREELSGWEKNFLDEAEPTTQSRIDATWRYEAAWTLLWVLGKVDDLPFPDAICDPAKVVHALREAGNAEGFCSRVSLRDLAEILDQTDLTSRLHWSVSSARIKQQPIPGNLQASVVLERIFTLNWALGNFDGWDRFTPKS